MAPRRSWKAARRGHGRVAVACLLAGPPQQPEGKELGPGHRSPPGCVVVPGMRRPRWVEHMGGVEIGPPGADDRADRRAAEDQTADSHARTCPSGGFALRPRPGCAAEPCGGPAAWRRDSSRGSSGSAASRSGKPGRGRPMARRGQSRQRLARTLGRADPQDLRWAPVIPPADPASWSTRCPLGRGRPG